MDNTETFRIGLGYNDKESNIRKVAKADHIAFWDMEAQKISWFEKWQKTVEWNPPFAKWFVGGKINASYNALDIHQATKSSKIAILWEGEDKTSKSLTYKQLWLQTQKFANVLKAQGIQKGDRITIYMPMIPEIIIAILACSRIGAIHTVVFSGFSASALRDRIEDSGSKMVITADVGYRRGKTIKLKEIVDEAITEKVVVHDNNSKDIRSSSFNDTDHTSCCNVRCVVVVQRTQDNNTKMRNNRDYYWDDLMKSSSDVCEAQPVESTHPLYILYTSGTTGKPKGVLHGTGGYLTHLHSTFRWAFDIQDNDIYFCTADIGWVTGHSYVVYAPLLCGATQVIYEGSPDYPNASRMWEIIQKYKVTIFYTTPTALRMFMKFGDALPNSFNLDTLKLLGTVGEPINPKVWRWYYKTIGKQKCPIIDTWWQTETGGMLISALPGIETAELKPGAGGKPIPGLDITVVDDAGTEITDGSSKGHLVIKNTWPGMLLGLWGNNTQKYKDTYWSKFKNCYYTGDYAIKDDDGYLWLQGRADDIIKVAGHRIGTAELESSVVRHPDVAESATCGIPDEVKGEVIVVFVVLNETATMHKTVEVIHKEIIEQIRVDVGRIATPKQICIVPKLPKTRSGKIMRRVLKSIASQKEVVGDTSTLEDGDQDTVNEIKRMFEQQSKV